MIFIYWLYVNVIAFIKRVLVSQYFLKTLHGVFSYFLCFVLISFPVKAANPIPRSYTIRSNNIAHPTAPTISSFRLPVPIGGSYTNGGVPNSNWLVSGDVTASVDGNASNPVLNLEQTTNDALLDWASFDIGANATVNFNQPSAKARAINRIYQSNPVQILGALKATGQVFLINQNGFIFGSTGSVNTSAFLASTMQMTTEAIQNGITKVIDSNQAAFEAFVDPNTGENLSQDIFIEEGFQANMSGGSNSRFIALARNVQNNGTIRTPDGQIILAAGNKAYITTSTSLPGWLIEVDSSNLATTDGRVVNGDLDKNQVRNVFSLTGRLIAERGNVSIVASAINQNGLISATTAVQKGGVIELRAQTDTKFIINKFVPTRSGEVIFGEGSVTKIIPDDSNVAVADQTVQPKSRITVKGKFVHLKKQSKIIATSGNVEITARENPEGVAIGDNDNLDKAGDGLIYIEGDIDVSGASVTKSVEDNLLTVDLRADEFKDSPVQRNAVLRGKTITFDIRKSGTREDGTFWEGTQLADVSGSIDGITRTATERNLTGGTIKLNSSQDTVITADAKLNISGGEINYTSGIINTTKIVSEGRIFDISDIKENQIVSSISDFLTQRFARYESGYIEGKDAGSLVIDSRRLVLQGVVDGQTQVGRLQRNKPSTEIPENRMYRAANEKPLTGRLKLGAQDPLTLTGFGTDYRMKNIRFVDYNPIRIPNITEVLDSEFDTILVASDLLRGIGRFEIKANKSITVADALHLPEFGDLSLTASQINILKDISSPGGSVNITATQTGKTDVAVDEIFIELADNTKIDVSGRWVNDNLFIARGVDQGSLSINGGTVVLEANATVSLNAEQNTQKQTSSQIRFGSGSEINVSAGATVTTKGKVKAGEAGDITLKASKTGITIAPSLSNLKAYGFNDSKGGKLVINSGELDLNICNTGCFLNTLAFSQSGFSDFELSTSGTNGDFNIVNGTHINISPFARITNRSVARQRTGSNIDSFTSLGRMPEEFTKPVSLTANAYIINIASNSSLNLLADPESKVSLTSQFQTYIDGTINVPSGLIKLSQTKSSDTFTNSSINSWLNHYIWLGKNAQLLARGASRVTQAGFSGIEFGEVYDGGNVNIESSTGYVIAESGALVDVSAISKVLDIQSIGGRSTIIHNVNVAGDAGGVSLTAREGILYQGDILAKRANVAGSSGGSLKVSFTDTVGARTGPANIQLGTDAPRTIILTNNNMESALESYSTGNGALLNNLATFGDNVNSNLNGLAVVSSELINTSGIESLNVSSYDFLSGSSLKSNGQVVLQGNLNLKLNNLIKINAPQIVSDGGSAVIEAPFIVIGSDDAREAETDNGLITLNKPKAGSGVVTFNADFIELLGRSAFSKQTETYFNSTGDIRFRGLTRPSSPDRYTIAGSLVSAGDLNFNAAQLYATTLSDFSIKTVDTIEQVDSLDVASVVPEINISSNGNTPTPILSAASRLTFEANKITQNGIIKAPLGEINLTGRQIVLNAGDTINQSTIESLLTIGANSIASTSTEGQIIPFGTLQAGKDWVYEIADGVFNVLTDGTSLVPAQSINYNADNMDIQEGAIFDIRGGGDLLAYEFVPGVDGTVDILDTAKHPNTFAILPGLNPIVAPYDPFIMDDVDLELGRSVFFDAPASGIATGNYTLLPARYALLPGAFLVEAVTGYQDLVPNTVFRQTDGSDIIAGRFTQNGTGRFASRNTGFRVLKNNSINNFARYDKAFASQFFTDNGYTGRIPLDDGRISITANTSLNLQAKILSQSGANGGRGSQVDIASNKLAVVTQSGQGNYSDDVIELTVAQLLALGADSLLLGGTRSSAQSADGAVTKLDVTATEVSIDNDVALDIHELILAATNNLTIKKGANLKATGEQETSDEVLQLQQDAAVVRLSSFNTARLQRSSDTTETSNLNIERGASLQADRAGLFSASNNFSLSGVNLDFTTASLTLAANQMNLGNAPQGTVGLNLSVTDINNLTAAELILDSVNSIDFYSSMNIATNSLTLRASALNAMADNTLVNFNVENKTRIENPAANKTKQDGTGSGTLVINSREIELGSTGDSNVAINGFGQVNLSANKQFVIDGKGTLATAANIQITTPVVTAVSGSEYKIGDVTDTNGMTNRAGNISIISNGVASDKIPQYLGGRLELASAGNINIDTLIQMNSGVLIANALGNVNVGNNATVDLSGKDIDFAGTVKGTPGGYFYAKSDGDIKLAKDAIVDVSAGTLSGNAGTIALLAGSGDVTVDATLLAHHAVDSKGGAFILDAKTLSRDVTSTDSAFTDLNMSLSLNGFNRTRAFRLRTGDITVETRKDIVANNIELVADEGGITIKAVLDASGEQAGNIRLAAKNNVTVFGTGDMYANATGKNQHGGRIFIGSTNGSLQLLNGSELDVSGTDSNRDGVITLRVARNATNDSIFNISRTRINSTFTGAYRVNLEAVESYDVTNIDPEAPTIITSGKLNQIRLDTNSFMENASAIKTALGRTESNFHITPGVEITSERDLTLKNDLNLATWHSNGEHSGNITLRAAGNININANLSDGFGVTGSKSSDLVKTDSWNIRLVAGADRTSANPMAVLDSLDEVGNLTVGSGTASNDPLNSPVLRYIRTGTGDIEIAAANDIKLSNAQSVIYTAGRVDPAISFEGQIPESRGGFFGNTSADLPYASDGGDVSLTAGRNIIGAYSTQLVTEWLWRVNKGENLGTVKSEDSLRYFNTAWTVSHKNFEQNIGLFGGGNSNISALGNITNLSVMNSTTGSRVINNSNNSELEITGGGNLSLTALGDINGGRYLVDRGEASLVSNNKVGKGTEYPVFLVGDGSLDITARGDVSVAGIGQWSLMVRSSEEKDAVATVRESSTGDKEVFGSYFFLYEDNNFVNLTSISGNSEIRLDSVGSDGGIKNELYSAEFLVGKYGSFTGDSEKYIFNILAPKLSVISFAGDVTISKRINLFPSANSDLELLAERNININGTINMSDADKSLLPGVHTQLSSLSASDSIIEDGVSLDMIFPIPFDTTQNTYGFVPVTADVNQTDGILNDKPVQVITRTGDIVFAASSKLNTTKSLNLVAGRDLISPSVRIQNIRDTDVSSIRAGRNILYPTTRDNDGGILTPVTNIDVAGPGQLYVTAGGDINLGTSGGIKSIGSRDNPSLPSGGADVTVLAGVPDISDFNAFTLSTIIAGIPVIKNIDDLKDFTDSIISGLSGVSDISDINNFEIFIDTVIDALPETPNFSNVIRTVITALPEVSDFNKFFTKIIGDNTESHTLVYQYVSDLGRNLYTNISQQVEAGLANTNVLSLTRQEQLNLVMTKILSKPDQLLDVYQSLNSTQLAYLYQAGIEQNKNDAFDTATLIDSLSVFYSLRPIDQQSLIYSVFYTELRNTGRDAIATGSDNYDRGFQAADLLFKNANQGNLSMEFSQIRTTDGGDINILAPNGRVDVGSSTLPESFGLGDKKGPQNLGIVVEAKGNINAFSWGDFLVNESRVFTADGGDILIWSSNGDIDAGRGAKTALASPEPQISFDDLGNVIVTIAPVLLGSGIRATALVAGEDAGDVDLIAPRGVVNAADAGIAGFNIFIPGDVIGLDNIDIGGEAAGFTLADNSVAVTLDVGGDVTSSVTSDVTDSISANGEDGLDDNSLALLFIEILGISDEEECDPEKDENCK